MGRSGVVAEAGHRCLLRKHGGPVHRRGADRTGVSSDTGLLDQWPSDGPRLVWTAEGAGRGYATVAISDGKLFTLGDGLSTADDDDEYLGYHETRLATLKSVLEGAAEARRYPEPAGGHDPEFMRELAESRRRAGVEMTAEVAQQGPPRELATGVDVIIDDTPDTVILSSFDPVRREIARVTVVPAQEELAARADDGGIDGTAGAGKGRFH